MKDTPLPEVSRSLAATQVYVVSAVCLLLGLVAGYVLRAWHAPKTVHTAAVSSPAAAISTGHIATLAEMKRLADKQASPLIEKLKTDPNNSALLVQIGTIYHTTHQFTAAASWYTKAVQADPSNVAFRNKLAASLYRSGDSDGAIAQLNQALHYAPTDANSLFNLGLILWQGKHDAQGALNAWQRLLKFNPGLSPDRKSAVKHLMAEVKAGGTVQPAADAKHEADAQPGGPRSSQP